MFKSGLHPIAWLALIPKVAALVKDCVDAWKDHRLTAEEIDRIGGEFVALVVAAASA